MTVCPYLSALVKWTVCVHWPSCTWSEGKCATLYTLHFLKLVRSRVVFMNVVFHEDVCRCHCYSCMMHSVSIILRRWSSANELRSISHTGPSLRNELPGWGHLCWIGLSSDFRKLLKARYFSLLAFNVYWLLCSILPRDALHVRCATAVLFVRPKVFALQCIIGKLRVHCDDDNDNENDGVGLMFLVSVIC